MLSGEEALDVSAEATEVASRDWDQTGYQLATEDAPEPMATWLSSVASSSIGLTPLDPSAASSVASSSIDKPSGLNPLDPSAAMGLCES